MDLLSSLAPLIEQGVGPVAIVAGVFTRLSAMALLLPGLGERAVAMRIRLAAAMAMTLVITPLVLAGDPAPPASAAALAVALGAEAVAGAIIGFSIRVAVYALQTAGAIAGQHISLAQLFGGGLDDQQESPVATVLMVSGIAVALAAGLHFKAVAALAVSYEVMPFGLFPGAAETGRWAAERAGWSFAAAFSLAMPFVVLGFIYNLALGAANRAMPQLMVAFVGAPAITLGGLVLLAATAPVLIKVWIGMTDVILRTLMGG